MIESKHAAEIEMVSNVRFSSVRELEFGALLEGAGPLPTVAWARWMRASLPTFGLTL